eukprot:4294061-Pleurochrysis_carterae.AAC.7
MMRAAHLEDPANTELIRRAQMLRKVCICDAAIDAADRCDAAQLRDPARQGAHGGAVRVVATQHHRVALTRCRRAASRSDYGIVLVRPIKRMKQCLFAAATLQRRMQGRQCTAKVMLLSTQKAQISSGYGRWIVVAAHMGPV